MIISFCSFPYVVEHVPIVKSGLLFRTLRHLRCKYGQCSFSRIVLQLSPLLELVEIPYSSRIFTIMTVYTSPLQVVSILRRCLFRWISSLATERRAWWCQSRRTGRERCHPVGKWP